MRCTEKVTARVTAQIKQEIADAAHRNSMTEAAWLKQLLTRELRKAEESAETVPTLHLGEAARRQSERGRGRSERPIKVSLRPEDRLLLVARAEARGMRPATYVSVFTRAHLRRLAPLPKDELLALRRSIAELAAIGRSLNQIGRTANENSRVPESAMEQFRSMLKICQALRDNTKALLKTNLASWESGHADEY